MIIFDPKIRVSLQEFGIQIPVHNSRTVQTYQALKSHPFIGPNLHLWHCDRIHERLTRRDLLRAHSKSYVNCLFSDQLENIIISNYELIDAQGNFYRYDPKKAIRPLTDLFQQTLYKASGTTQCARSALENGFCYYFSGGTHHAHPGHGSGFCMINDIVIAARKMQAEEGIGKVWIIDTDAHKGDGTAAMTADDDTINTLSIHMAHGWPLDGPQILPDGSANPAFTPSDIDIPVASGDEHTYIDCLEQGLGRLAPMGPADLAIVVTGADAYEQDELPSTENLKLTLGQLMDRDRLVYNFLKANRVPAAYLMAGGYGDKVWQVFARFLTWALQKEYGG